MRALQRDLGYKLLSLGLGILLYIVVFQQNNPRTSQELVVQPEVEQLPANMALKAPPDPVTVTITGNLAALQAFRALPIKATVDLSHADAGGNRFPLHYKNDLTLVDLSGPSVARVALEKKTWRTFPVQVNYNDTAPPGFAFKSPLVNPTSVKVKGAKSEIAKVEFVVAVADNTGPFSGQVDLVAQTKNREAMDTVEMEPRQASVTLDVKATPASKALILSPAFSGKSPAGFAVTSYTFDPQFVTVTGETKLLINRSRLTVPIDLSEWKESATQTVTVPVPPGMTMVEPTDGRVSLRLEIAALAVPTPAATPTPISIPVTSPSPLKENP